MDHSASDNNLENLKVIDRLEIGPVRVEAQRLIAPYTVIQNGKTEQTDLIYRYQEEVFIPGEAESQNLANMIAAQVAFNYGIFCNQIVFKGYFDHQDRRFIRDMTENTSREIFVKKILEPNIFLTGPAVGLNPERLKKYTQAEIVFEEKGVPALQASWRLWETNPAGHAILSSGGKDSLLTYGLLNEAGVETHPVFINESGRHWFTALNAHRYYEKKVPHTARVWTNADRLFNSMLRHLPFIRKDYASVRSDEYPVRLWTVAVFLFGALPLMRKRKLGRLLIGDEYDTTVKNQFQGISHYEGLYDQSRYFDNALSRYFMAKGWSVVQFSILRPLSELLIEKILVERYPHLQEHQVSCHAAHKEGERIHPCGKCEKCRRIIGMLTALGADPRNCGYTEDQIKHSLKILPDKKVHQESAGQSEMMALLAEKGLVASSSKYKRHPEVLHLRIDAERSPVNGIPIDLRSPLFTIMLQHALGALRRTGRKWETIDLLNDTVLQSDYPFEAFTLAGTPGRMHSRHSLLGELTWPDAEAYLKMVDVALLPVGAIEQHGPHLPLDTDAFDADYLARQVASACSTPRPLVLPLIPYGVSYHHDDFKGTLSINNETLSQLVYEIGMSAARNGIRKLLIINGHGGNSPALNFAAQKINRDARIFVGVDSGETSDVDIDEMVETPNDVHAGEFETSTTLAVRPHLVKKELAEKMVPDFSSRYLNFSSRRGVTWYAYTKRISESGIMGDPTKATAEKGRRMWKIMIAHLTALVEDLKRMTLDEIHQRRY